MTKVTVIGSGAWGTALAIAASHTNENVSLWGREEDHVHETNEIRENKHFLPGVKLPDGLLVTSDKKVIQDAELIILSVPAQKMRFIMANFKEDIGHDVPLIITSKGIEQRNHCLMTDVLTEILPRNPLAILSGPTFASEVGRGLPAACTLAAENDDVRQFVIETLSSSLFRLYGSTDMVGAQVGGSVKNVIAIATGIAVGLGYGENAVAALISRGLVEMTRFGMAFGALPETFMGLCGVGDLMLTCSSQTSRNHRYGVALGKGLKVGEKFEGSTLVEGFFTTESVVAIAQKLGVSLPICEFVDSVLNHGMEIKEATEAMMKRPYKIEEIDFKVG